MAFIEDVEQFVEASVPASPDSTIGSIHIMIRLKFFDCNLIMSRKLHGNNELQTKRGSIRMLKHHSSSYTKSILFS